MTHKATHTINLKVFDENDNALETITLRLTIGVTFGEPESGRWGPPEDYDPGSGDELWIERVERLMPDGSVRGALPHEKPWAEARLENNRDSVAKSAADDIEDRRADYAYDRWRDDRMGGL